MRNIIYILFALLIVSCSTETPEPIQEDDRVLIELGRSDLVMTINGENLGYVGATKKQLTIPYNSQLKIRIGNSTPNISTHYRVIIWINDVIVYEKSDKIHYYERM